MGVRAVLVNERTPYRERHEQVSIRAITCCEGPRRANRRALPIRLQQIIVKVVQEVY